MTAGRGNGSKKHKTDERTEDTRCQGKKEGGHACFAAAVTIRVTKILEVCLNGAKIVMTAIKVHN